MGLVASYLYEFSFLATWNAVAGASGYRFDLSVDPVFGSFVAGYQNLDVGAVTSWAVSGLAASTTYYWRVRAYNGAGASASSAPATTITKADAAGDWSTQVVTNGGAAPAAATVSAIRVFYHDLLDANIYSKMLSVNGLVPDSLIAAMTPFVRTFGGAVWTPVNLTVANLSVNGFAGNGANGRVDTGVIAATCFPDNTSGGISVYVSNQPDASGWDIASYGAANSCYGLMARISGTTSWQAFDQTTGILSPVFDMGATSGKGFYSGNRRATNNSAIYEASSLMAFKTLGSNATVSNGALCGFQAALFCTNVSGSYANFRSMRLSFVAYHLGLTSAEAQALYNSVVTLRGALGGGLS